jgi:hypothetical protein
MPVNQAALTGPGSLGFAFGVFYRDGGAGASTLSNANAIRLGAQVLKTWGGLSDNALTKGQINLAPNDILCRCAGTIMGRLAQVDGCPHFNWATQVTGDGSNLPDEELDLSLDTALTFHLSQITSLAGFALQFEDIFGSPFGAHSITKLTDQESFDRSQTRAYSITGEGQRRIHDGELPNPDVQEQAMDSISNRKAIATMQAHLATLSGADRQAKLLVLGCQILSKDSTNDPELKALQRTMSTGSVPGTSDLARFVASIQSTLFQHCQAVIQKRGATNSAIDFHKATLYFVTYNWKFYATSGPTKDYAEYCRGFKPGTTHVIEMRSLEDIKAWVNEILAMYAVLGNDITDVTHHIEQRIKELALKPGLTDQYARIAEKFVKYMFHLFANAMSKDGNGYLRSMSGAKPKLIDLVMYTDVAKIPPGFSLEQRRLAEEMVKAYNNLIHDGALQVAGMHDSHGFRAEVSQLRQCVQALVAGDVVRARSLSPTNTGPTAMTTYRPAGASAPQPKRAKFSIMTGPKIPKKTSFMTAGKFCFTPSFSKKFWTHPANTNKPQGAKSRCVAFDIASVPGYESWSCACPGPQAKGHDAFGHAGFTGPGRNLPCPVFPPGQLKDLLEEFHIPKEFNPELTNEHFDGAAASPSSE